MQVLHSLHVPPYPDPYPSLTESPISDSTSQPPARSLTCMRPGLVLPVKQPPTPPRPPSRSSSPFPSAIITCQQASSSVSLIRSGGGGLRVWWGGV